MLSSRAALKGTSAEFAVPRPVRGKAAQACLVVLVAIYSVGTCGVLTGLADNQSQATRPIRLQEGEAVEFGGWRMEVSVQFAELVGMWKDELQPELNAGFTYRLSQASLPKAKEHEGEVVSLAVIIHYTCLQEGALGPRLPAVFAESDNEPLKPLAYHRFEKITRDKLNLLNAYGLLDSVPKACEKGTRMVDVVVCPLARGQLRREGCLMRVRPSVRDAGVIEVMFKPKTAAAAASTQPVIEDYRGLAPGPYTLEWTVPGAGGAPATGRDDDVEVFREGDRLLLKIAGNKYFGGATSLITVRGSTVTFDGQYARQGNLLFEGTLRNGTVAGKLAGKLREDTSGLDKSKSSRFTLTPTKER